MRLGLGPLERALNIFPGVSLGLEGALLYILQVTLVNEERGSQEPECRSAAQHWVLDIQETLRLTEHIMHHPLDAIRKHLPYLDLYSSSWS